MRGFLRIGPGTVARHQLTLALALDCQLIVCIARNLAPQVIELQHAAEKAGARFQCVPGARALASLVTANDDVLVVSDGLLASPRCARELLADGPAVLVQPVETGTVAGFERVDINHAACGMLRIPGHLIERLSELPTDCDVASALTRVALQAGIAQRELPAAMRDGFDWVLVRNEQEAHRIELGWIARQIDGDGYRTAGSLLARFGVKRVGPALLHAGSGGNVVTIGALVFLLLAAGAAWGQFTAGALVLCMLAWLLRRASGLLLRIERKSQGMPRERWSREAAFGWLLDAVLVATLAWSPQNPVWSSLVERLFGPVMLLCVLRLLPRIFAGRWIGWAADRAALAALLAVASAAAVLIPAVHGLAALLALAGICMPLNRAGSVEPRLTRV